MNFHEFAHGIDSVHGDISQNEVDFGRAYDRDHLALPLYYNRKDQSGVPERASNLQETFAEMFARFYQNREAFAANPALADLYAWMVKFDADSQSAWQLKHGGAKPPTH